MGSGVTVQGGGLRHGSCRDFAGSSDGFTPSRSEWDGVAIDSSPGLYGRPVESLNESDGFVRRRADSAIGFEIREPRGEVALDGVKTAGSLGCNPERSCLESRSFRVAV